MLMKELHRRFHKELVESCDRCSQPGDGNRNSELEAMAAMAIEIVDLPGLVNVYITMENHHV